MKKYVCTVCGYIAEGEIPAQCPVCKAPASAFVEKRGNTYPPVASMLGSRAAGYRKSHGKKFCALCTSLSMALL